MCMFKLYVKFLLMLRVEMVKDLYIFYMFVVYVFLCCIYGLLNSLCIDIFFFLNLENVNCFFFFKNCLIFFFYCYIRCFFFINIYGFIGSCYFLLM